MRPTTYIPLVGLLLATWVALMGAGEPVRAEGEAIRLPVPPSPELQETEPALVESEAPEEQVSSPAASLEEPAQAAEPAQDENQKIEPRATLPDPWTHMVVEGCEAVLAERGVTEYSFLSKSPRKTLKAPRRRKPEWPELTDHTCHVPQAMHYRKGPGNIKYTGYVLVNCKTALALARLEEIAQEEAVRIFGKYRTVRSIRQYGTYNCRRLRKKPWVQSQHSFGNAIDIAAFRIRGYGWIDLKSFWNPKRRSQKKGSEFLRAVADRLVEEQVFINVLTPEDDRAHADHFHLDMEPIESVIARGGDLPPGMGLPIDGAPGPGHHHTHGHDDEEVQPHARPEDDSPELPSEDDVTEATGAPGGTGRVLEESP